MSDTGVQINAKPYQSGILEMIIGKLAGVARGGLAHNNHDGGVCGFLGDEAHCGSSFSCSDEVGLGAGVFMKQVLITGAEFPRWCITAIETLGYRVVNGSSHALALLGIPEEDRDRELTEVETELIVENVSIYVYGGLEPASKTILNAAKMLELIIFLGTAWADTGCVDAEAARERGVVVSNTPFANSPSVAEMTMGLILSLSRGIVAMNNSTKSGLWRPIKTRGIAGRQLGIIGLGHIGEQVAKHARLGFGMEVVYFGPNRKLALETTLGIRYCDLDQLLLTSDIVSIHSPVRETWKLIDRSRISLLKKDALLLNLSNIHVVDSIALLEALETGAIRGAAMDGLYSEPNAVRERFLALDDKKFIVLPRAAWLTEESYKRMANMALQSIHDFAAGHSPVTHQVLPIVTS